MGSRSKSARRRRRDAQASARSQSRGRASRSKSRSKHRNRATSPAAAPCLMRSEQGFGAKYTGSGSAGYGHYRESAVQPQSQSRWGPPHESGGAKAIDSSGHKQYYTSENNHTKYPAEWGGEAQQPSACSSWSSCFRAAAGTGSGSTTVTAGAAGASGSATKVCLSAGASSLVLAGRCCSVLGRGAATVAIAACTKGSGKGITEGHAKRVRERKKEASKAIGSKKVPSPQRSTLDSYDAAHCGASEEPIALGAAGPLRASCLFFPSEEAFEQVLGLIRGARRSVDVAAFSFTERRIADALMDAAGRGVLVRVVVHCENGEQTKSSEAARMLRIGREGGFGSGGGVTSERSGGLQVRELGYTTRLGRARSVSRSRSRGRGTARGRSPSPVRGRVRPVTPCAESRAVEEGSVGQYLMHNKFIVIDGDAGVLTGSLNFTRQGWKRNRENAVVLTGGGGHAAGRFLREFEDMWKEASDMGVGERGTRGGGEGREGVSPARRGKEGSVGRARSPGRGASHCGGRRPLEVTRVAPRARKAPAGDAGGRKVHCTAPQGRQGLRAGL